MSVRLAAVAAVTTLLLAMGLVTSVSLGARPIGADAVASALLRYDPAREEHRIVRDMRLPRALAAALVGAALAGAGTVLQGLTRNPLASPSLFGLSSGAALASILALSWRLPLGPVPMMAVSVAGAALGALLVFVLGFAAGGGARPVRLALAGAGVSALLSSLSNGIVIQQNLAHDALSWFGRGVQNVGWSELGAFASSAAPGLAVAFLLAPGLTVLSLGEESARGLGQRVAMVYVAGGLIALLLAGGACSLAGTIPFVGLMAPHLARALVGLDYRRIVPCAALLGAVLLLFADLGARLLTAREGSPVPVGLLTTLAGVPFLLRVVRRMDLA